MALIASERCSKQFSRGVCTVHACMPCHDTIRQVSTRYLYVILAGYHRPHWDVCCAVLLPVNVGRRTCGCIVSKEKKRTCGCSGSLCYRNPGESILGLTRCKKQARGFQESLWMWLASAFSKVSKALECEREAKGQCSRTNLGMVFLD